MSKQSNGRKSFLVYFTFGRMADYMSDEEAGRLFKAVVRYADKREEPDFEDNRLLSMAFENFRALEDDDLSKWVITREKRVKAGEISAQKRAEQKKTNQEIDDFLNSDDCPFK